MDRHLKRLYYGTLLAITGLLFLAAITGYYVLNRIHTLPGWYVNNPDEFILPLEPASANTPEIAILHPNIFDSTLNKVRKNTTDEPQIKSASRSLIINPKTATNRKPPLPGNALETARQSRSHQNNKNPTQLRKQYISEAELPLILVNTLEENLNQDIRHGIRAIRAKISVDKLQIESILDVDYFNSIQQLQSDPIWNYMRKIGGDELYVMVELYPSKYKYINQLSPKSNLTIGDVTLSLSQVERMTGISVRQMIKSLDLPVIRLSSGALVAG
ncbi:MAG: hypothetical protein GXO90_06340 [FCB group bacterium]|nr:hypothetical protein [FCB group bacterium]